MGRAPVFAYRDIVSLDDLRRHTKGVKPGDTADDAKCDATVAEDVAEHNAGIRQCITRAMSPPQGNPPTSLAFIAVWAPCVGQRR